MATIKRCDRCGKDLDLSNGPREYKYEEDGKEYIVNSIRIGNWNPKTKQWESIVSAYDLCPDCGEEVTRPIFDVLHGTKECLLKTRIPRKKDANESNNGV